MSRRRSTALLGRALLALLLGSALISSVSPASASTAAALPTRSTTSLHGLTPPGATPPGGRIGRAFASGAAPVAGPSVASDSGPDVANLTDIWGFGPSEGAAPLNVTFQANPAGGVPPYTLTWLFGDGSGFRSSNSTFAHHTYAVDGVYIVTLYTNDSAADSISSWGRVVAEPNNITVSNISVAPPLLDVGQAVIFTVAAAGGAGPLTYYWYGLPTGCYSRNISSLFCVPSGNGTFDVDVYVSDPLGAGVASNSSTVVVNPDPYIAGWSVSPSSLAPGETATMSVRVAGGTPPYNYTWSGLPSACTGSDTATLTCRPTAYGLTNVSVDAIDRLGFHAFAGPSPLRVVPFGIGVPRASQDPAEVGSRLTLSVDLSTGATPDLVEWIGQLPNCASGYGAILPCLPRLAGTFNLTVQLDDAQGRSAVSAPLVLVVHPRLELQIDPSPAPAIAGEGWTLATTITGGVGPFHFDYLGLPAGCPSNDTARLTCTPTTPSSTVVTVDVTDADGVNAQQLVNVTVALAPTTFLVQSGWLPLLGVGGAFAAMVAVGIVVVVRRSREPPPAGRARPDNP